MTSEDLPQVPPGELIKQVMAMRAFADQRPARRALVEVSEESGGTVLSIVTDDMPFLVDSVTSELARQGRTVRLVIHPLLSVHRDDQGHLTEVLDVDIDADRPAGALAESWMRIEMERDYLSQDDAAIARRVTQVLADVRAAVEDWPEMRQRALHISRELNEHPPHGVEATEASDAANLLAWLAQDHFTFLGFREYHVTQRAGEEILDVLPESGLGILREVGATDPHISKSFSELAQPVRARIRVPQVLQLNKANVRSTVHRDAYLDYVGIKTFDAAGQVVGEQRFLGLFTASAYAEPISEVPGLSRKLQAVLEALELVPGSHSAKDLQQFLQTYPRDELFQLSLDELVPVAEAAMHLQDRRQTKLFARIDDYGRYASCIVYLPRDRYTTTVRQAVERLLVDAFDGVGVDYTAWVTESVLARVHYVIHLATGTDPAQARAVDLQSLQADVAQATRSWEDDFTDAMVAELGESEASRLLPRYLRGYSTAYKAAFGADQAVQDAITLERLSAGELSLDLRWYEVAGDTQARFSVIRIGPAMSLSRILPILQAMGAEVIDERPYQVDGPDAAQAWILDFGLVLPEIDADQQQAAAQRFCDGFAAAWSGQCESDALNGLILLAGLTWRDVVLVRALVRYIRQIGVAFGQEYIHQVLLANAAIISMQVALFNERLNPQLQGSDDAEQRSGGAAVEAIQRALDAVPSLDHDRILRLLLSVVMATLRTNVFIPERPGRHSLAFKIDSSVISELPPPRPWVEIWVYSPRVEGVHLRRGSVARGGLRWSDRREDLRTEILGLVKAQEVKNAVIVPVGAKGGFCPATLPDPALDRDAWMQEGKACYREYVSALLDITDNLVDGQIVPPADVVRRDGDDPYLVVAADKGTATFSDLANSIAAEYHFWLGDAFASGGSAGYDHKVMGITARGAWESVLRHFREIDLNPQKDEFTAVGIGDMSGDVFGNGMLLSNHMKLIAAFDHRDIFIDPTPDPSKSFEERRRLFSLPRSSWQDYDTSLLSTGGGVFSRSVKSIELSPEAWAALGLPGEPAPCSPQEVVQAILQAPVHLLWNGGIGTYIKARTQSNADVGDRANDAVRINGDQLRCQVVGEGGNLGLTQLGRVEAARHGVRLNTDAIDNSGGVDTSDHEVNLKILLADAIKVGELAAADRNELLASLTDQVAEAVLADNYAQNVTLGAARFGAANLISVHQRMIRDLERSGLLNRAVENLPDDEELRTRQLAGQGLTSPELAVLLAYAKISLTAALNASDLARDPWYGQILRQYFPTSIAQRFDDILDAHPLRDRIINTVVCNRLINTGGISVVFRAIEETGAQPIDVVRAATVSIEVFDIAGIYEQINALDGQVSTDLQCRLQLETRRLLDRSIRWFLQTRGGAVNVAGEIKRLQPIVQRFASVVPTSLLGAEADRLRKLTTNFEQDGAPSGLAQQVASSLDLFALLDISDIATRSGEDPSTVIPLYFTISERYDMDRTLLRITALPRSDRWNALARQALRSDLYSAIAALTARVVRFTDAALPPLERVLIWERAHAAGLARARSTLDEVAAQEEVDLATLSVALRVLRTLVAQGSASSTTPAH